MNNVIKLGNDAYEVVDQIDEVRIADSFVKENKVGTGNGEARLYLGSQANEGKDFEAFFGDFSAKALFLKRDFEDYLSDAKFEYEEQEQAYQQDIAAHWQRYKDQAANLKDLEYFSVERAIGTQDTQRYYVRSNDAIWDYFRSIMLPVISYVTILKIRDAHGNTFFLFRPTLNYFYNKNYHPAKIDEEVREIEAAHIPEEEKKSLRAARNGQGDYRRRLLDEKAECLISKVNDERLLIASHIKPWSVSDENEKIDHFNGLALIPTYDRMFDQGYISFEDDGTIIISPYISPLNIKKLGLVPEKRYEIPNIERRKKYLAYHRESILRR